MKPMRYALAVLAVLSLAWLPASADDELYQVWFKPSKLSAWQKYGRPTSYEKARKQARELERESPGYQVKIEPAEGAHGKSRQAKVGEWLDRHCVTSRPAASTGAALHDALGRLDGQVRMLETVARELETTRDADCCARLAEACAVQVEETATTLDLAESAVEECGSSLIDWVPVPLRGKQGNLAHVEIRYHYEGQDYIHVETIPDATGPQLVEKLQELADKHAWVHEITIKGHGTDQTLTLHDESTLLVTSGSRLTLMLPNSDFVDITCLFEQVLVRHATIYFKSCSTGAGTDSIAAKTSQALPGRTVWGGEGTLYGPASATWAIGDENAYRDGELVED